MEYRYNEKAEKNGQQQDRGGNHAQIHGDRDMYS